MNLSVEVIIIVLLVLCGIISGVAGYFCGLKLSKHAKKLSEQTLVDISADSTVQAQLIGKAIKKRAVILGHENLSWMGVFDEKKTYYAFDGDTSDCGVHTMTFLYGNSTKLIKFIRICHACGCSVTLRQLGTREDELQRSGQKYYLSKYDLNKPKK